MKFENLKILIKILKMYNENDYYFGGEIIKTITGKFLPSKKEKMKMLMNLERFCKNDFLIKVEKDKVLEMQKTNTREKYIYVLGEVGTKMMRVFGFGDEKYNIGRIKSIMPLNFCYNYIFNKNIISFKNFEKILKTTKIGKHKYCLIYLSKSEIKQFFKINKEENTINFVDVYTHFPTNSTVLAIIKQKIFDDDEDIEVGFKTFFEKLNIILEEISKIKQKRKEEANA